MIKTFELDCPEDIVTLPKQSKPQKTIAKGARYL